MQIARHLVLSNSLHAANLPPSWYTLVRLTEFEDAELEELLRDGKIDRQTEREEVEVLAVNFHKRNARPNRTPLRNRSSELTNGVGER